MIFYSEQMSVPEFFSEFFVAHLQSCFGEPVIVILTGTCFPHMEICIT